MNTEVKVAKINAELEQMRMFKDTVLTVFENPVFEYIAGVSLIEYVVQAKVGDAWYISALKLGDKVAWESTLAAICTAKAISPALNSPAGQSIIGKFIK